MALWQAGLSFFQPATAMDAFTLSIGDIPASNDTVKYRGYRLHLTDFEILKQTDDWVKIKCTIVNSGRMAVDFSKKGTEHWVQVNFDQTLFAHKLGGLRENIRQAMYEENLHLSPGEVLRDKQLKVPVIILRKTEKESNTISFSTPEPEEEQVAFTSKGGNEIYPEPESTHEKCPDIYFSNLRITEQNDKWATLEYTIENQGSGVFNLAMENGDQRENLAIRAYISGVTTLSRGAIPIGGQFVQIEPDRPKDLYPGGKFTGKIRLDVRKKTRYMKSLILSLDSNQFHQECDKTNNTGAVVLE